MNKQIRQLLIEAQTLAREEVKNTPEFAKYAPSYAIPGTEIHVGLGLSYEKLAELIVRECSNLVFEYGGGTDSDDGKLWDLANRIENHFGVEA